MLTHLRPSALAASSLLLALTPAADKVAFHPADGSEMSKNLHMEGSFELGDFTMIVNGQDMSGMVPLEQASGEVKLDMAIVDHYVKTADGKPLELVRDFGKSKVEWSAVEESGTEEDWIELDGESVVFKWNEETKSYDKSFKDGEGDEEKIADIGIDLDYRTFLPGKDVAEGDRWKVDSKGVGTALTFGNEFKDMASIGEETIDPELEALLSQIEPEMQKLADSFQAECEYAGSRDESGVRVGVIKIKLECNGSIDLAQIIEDVASKQIPPEANASMSVDTAAMTLKMRGEGQLLWDLAAGRPYSFEMAADVELGFELEAAVEAEGQNQSIEAGIEVLGKAAWSMEKGG